MGVTDVLLALSFATHRHEDLLALLAFLLMVPIGSIAAVAGSFSAPAPANVQVHAHVLPSTDVVQGRRVDAVIAGF